MKKVLLAVLITLTASFHAVPASNTYAAPVVKSAKHVTQVPAPYFVSPAQFQAWSKVAWCEEHDDWTLQGSVYSGSLGITNVNWATYAPASFPRSAAKALHRQQIWVAMRINAGHPIPDQEGVCEKW